MKLYAADSEDCGLFCQDLTVSKRRIDLFQQLTVSITPEEFRLVDLTKSGGRNCQIFPGLALCEVQTSSTLSKSVVITRPTLGGFGIPKVRASSVRGYQTRSPRRNAQSSAHPI